MTSRYLSRRLERLEDSLLPANEEPIVFRIILVSGDGQRVDSGMECSSETAQEEAVVKGHRQAPVPAGGKVELQLAGGGL